MQLFEPAEAGFEARPITSAAEIAGGARVIPVIESDGRRFAALIVVGPDVRLNGDVPLPLTILQRGDEIRCGGVSVFYTNEAPLCVTPFERRDGETKPPECTRCHRPVQVGDPVVRCPVCGVLYMAQADKQPNCWTFGPCLVCGRDPHAQFVWRPRHAPRRVAWHDRPWRRNGVEPPTGTREPD
jgi:hypothetical protein